MNCWGGCVRLQRENPGEVHDRVAPYLCAIREVRESRAETEHGTHGGGCSGLLKVTARLPSSGPPRSAARPDVLSRPPFWEHSSAGSEHLPYKQRVTGSNPVAPTEALRKGSKGFFFRDGWFRASRPRREGHWSGSGCSHIGGSFYFRAPQRDLSSAGSERMLHTHEVTGSNPVGPTKPRDRGAFSWWIGAGSERPAPRREGHWFGSSRSHEAPRSRGFFVVGRSWFRASRPTGGKVTGPDPVGPTQPRDRGAGSSGSGVDRGVDRWLCRPASARDQSTSATTNTLPVTSTRSSGAAAARAASKAWRTEGCTRPRSPASAAARARVPASRPRGMSALQK